jgi:hypothetical protein
MTGLRALFVGLVVLVVAGVLVLLFVTSQPRDPMAWEYLSMTYQQTDTNGNDLPEDAVGIESRYRTLFPLSLCDGVSDPLDRAACLENTSADIDLYLNTLAGDGWEVQQILPSEQGGVTVYLRRSISATQAVGVLTQLPNRVAAVSTVLAEASETSAIEADANATQAAIVTQTARADGEIATVTADTLTQQADASATAFFPMNATHTAEAYATDYWVQSTAVEAALATAVAEANANNTATAIVVTGTNDANLSATANSQAAQTQAVQATAAAQTTATFRANSTATQIAANSFATEAAQNANATTIAQAVNETVSAIAADASATALRQSVLATGQARLQQGTEIAASITAQANNVLLTAESRDLTGTAMREASNVNSIFADATATTIARVTLTAGGADTTQAALDNVYTVLTSTAAQRDMQATLNAGFGTTPVGEAPTVSSAFEQALAGQAQIQTLQAAPQGASTPAPEPPTNENFDTVRGSLIGNRAEYWSFVGYAGEEVIITLYGDFGKTVSLYRSVRGTDFLLQTEANTVGDQSAIELRRTLLRDGDYVVEVIGLPGESGDYYFTVEINQP